MSFTLLIIIFTCIISIMAFNNREMMTRFQLNPYSVIHRGEWFRVITHGFLHADYMHLFVNMFVLFMFGGAVEEYFRAYFREKAILYLTLMYFGAIIVSVISTLQKHKNDIWYNGVGASGAVSAVLFSSILFQPMTKLCLYGIPFLCFPGFIWAIAYVVYSYYQGKKSMDNINHEAHLYGALFGIAFTLMLRPATGLDFIHKIMNWL